jgi:hypothetical protein
LVAAVSNKAARINIFFIGGKLKDKTGITKKTVLNAKISF